MATSQLDGRVAARQSASITGGYFPTHANPSGPLPVATSPTTSIFLKSTTTTLFAPATATKARDPSGTIKIPPDPPPIFNVLISLRVAASITAKLAAAPDPPGP